MWFKEYIFNVIIQPVHLLLYVVLIGAAIDLAKESLIYAVVAMYFMTPAEKLIRKFFGFDNAGTLSAAGSFAGGALFSAMINKMSKPKVGPDKDDDSDKGQNTRKPTKSYFRDEEQIFGRNLPDVNNRTSRKSEDHGGSGTRWLKKWTDEFRTRSSEEIQAVAQVHGGGPAGAGGDPSAQGRTRRFKRHNKIF